MNYKNKLRAIGIMNGTSLDGIDLVLAEVTKKPIGIKFLDIATIKFSQKLRTRLIEAAKHQIKIGELVSLHHDLGRFYELKITQVVKRKKWKFDIIGLHGQTVFHAGKNGTMQIGEPSYLAQSLKAPVVSDFRAADIAAGGEGAPIASLFHGVCFTEKDKSIVVQNLGGMGNLTFVKKGHVEFAFDTGPGNMLIDLLVSKSTKNKLKFDKNGSLAARGVFFEKEVQSIFKLSKYFKKLPPKSCGREEFGEVFLKKALKKIKSKKLEDQLATLTELTALSISHAIESFLAEKVHKIFLCGGGAHNSHLLKRIFERSDVEAVYTSEIKGWSPESVEGGAFALLAALRVWKIPGNIPQTTGAKQKVLLGKIVEV